MNIDEAKKNIEKAKEIVKELAGIKESVLEGIEKDAGDWKITLSHTEEDHICLSRKILIVILNSSGDFVSISNDN